ncbi:MAG: hypothetical protein KKH72_14525 [Alphaproteobacteria bacterium]|nr:hypothetical protein [Alphaproteobacteria bacterium]
MSVLTQALPILLLIAIGVGLRVFSVITAATVEDLKTLVVTLVLPSVLFTVFLDLDFQPAYAGVFVLVAAICLALLVLGRWLGRRLAPNRPYFPFMLTGFEYGMLGVSLFGAAYGFGNMGYIAIVDLSHEFFIWFVYVPLLMVLRDGASRPSTILKLFVTSPVIIGLVGGIVLNALGLSETIKTAPVVSSVYQVMTLLIAMAVPIILIIVGYGTSIRREGLREVLFVVGLRYAIIVPAALILNHFVIAGVFGLGQPFQVAFFSLMILPPSFIIPVFMQTASAGDKAYVTNVLAVSTVVTLVIFSVYLGLNPGLV